MWVRGKSLCVYAHNAAVPRLARQLDLIGPKTFRAAPVFSQFQSCPAAKAQVGSPGPFRND